MFLNNTKTEKHTQLVKARFLTEQTSFRGVREGRSCESNSDCWLITDSLSTFSEYIHIKCICLNMTHDPVLRFFCLFHKTLRHKNLFSLFHPQNTHPLTVRCVCIYKLVSLNYLSSSCTGPVGKLSQWVSWSTHCI